MLDQLGSALGFFWSIINSQKEHEDGVVLCGQAFYKRALSHWAGTVGHYLEARSCDNIQSFPYITLNLYLLNIWILCIFSLQFTHQVP